MKKKLLLLASLLLVAFTLVACTDTKTYTVTFNSNQGSAVESFTADEGGLVTKPADPKKDNFEFVAWFKEAALTNEWIFATDKVSGDMTLYAKWKEVEAPVETKVKVTFHLNYSGSALPSVVEVVKGKTVAKITDPVREDFAFKGWALTPTGTTPFVFTTAISDNITLYAIWETTQETVVVTFNADNGTEIVTLTEIVGQPMVPPTDPVREVGNFLGWFNGETLWNFEDSVTEAMTLVARYTDRDGIPISSPQQFIEMLMGQKVTEGVYYLTNDLDFTGITVTHTSTKSEFEAEFDGEGYTIKNFTSVATEADVRAGVFGILKNAEIKNLVIENANVSAFDRAGILAAEIVGGAGALTTITNVTIIDSKVQGSNKDNAVGGVAAYINADADISNIRLVGVSVEAAASSAQATPKGAGLITGRANNGLINITDIFVQGSVKGFEHTGGLVGVTNKTLKGMEITNAVVLITVEGVNYVSGIVGRQQMENEALLELTNIVADVIIKGTPGNYTGYFTGRLENNTLETIRENVFISVDGVQPKVDNAITGAELVEQADAFYDKVWFEANQPQMITGVWVLHTSGLYVLEGLEELVIAVPEYATVTLHAFEGSETTHIIRKGLSLDKPKDPTRAGFEFRGWVVEEVAFDFTEPITDDLLVSATWESIVTGELELAGLPVLSTDNKTIVLEFLFKVEDVVLDVNSTTMKQAFVTIGGNRTELTLTTDGTTVSVDVLAKGTVHFEFFDLSDQKHVATIQMADFVNEAELHQTETAIGQLIEGDTNYYIEYDVKAGEEVVALVEGKVESVYQMNETNGLGWGLRNVFGTNPHYLQLATGDTGVRNLLIVDATGKLFLVEHTHTVHHVVTLTIEDKVEVRVLVHGAELVLSMVTENEEIIEAWYRNEDFTTLFEGTEVVETLDLHAKITEKEALEVTFTWEGLTEPIKVVVLEGNVVETELIVKEGFDLVGFYSDLELTTAFDIEAAITVSVTVYVKWAAKEFTKVVETYDLVNNASNPYFKTVQNSTLELLNPIELEGVTYTGKQTLKLDGKEFITITTQSANAVVRIAASERHFKDYGVGMIDFNFGDTIVETVTLDKIELLNEASLTGANLQIIEVTLAEAGEYVISRNSAGKEMMIFFIEVTELR